MSEKLVYLAGGISGLTLEEAVAWRSYVAGKFTAPITAVSPLRGKTEYLKGIVGQGTIADHYTNKLLSTRRGITTRDRMDVTRCHCLFANLLNMKMRPAEMHKVSIGTVAEIAWADMLRKPIVVVMEKDNPHQHAMVVEMAGFITDNLDEGIDVVNQLLRTGV